MAELELEQEVMGAASPSPSDHKRKHEDLEPDAPERPSLTADSNVNSESDSAKKAEVDDSEAKRPRLEDNPHDLATENGFQEEKVDEPDEVIVQPTGENDTHLEDAQRSAEEVPGKVNNEEPASDDHKDSQGPDDENIQIEKAQEEPSEGQPSDAPEEIQEPPVDVPQQEDGLAAEEQATSETKTTSRKMEVPNTKVGVLIGKAGDTIRYLQYNSGARIQITRDADADPYAATRPVELIGTLENINKAEKLIKDVIAEADAGGSPSLVARGFSTVQAAGAGEILIQVPNEKVGVIIGKGGETIKNLQTRSGARIQLMPQHLPEGDQSKERIVRVTGDKKQIEMAREMIKEVMDQPVRPSPLSSGYNQQGFRPRGSAAQWGSRGPHPAQQTGYDYQQQHRGPYTSQNPQYPPQAYGSYPPQQLAPRANFGWEQRPQATMQGPPSHGGYDYYGGQGGHAASVPQSVLSHPTHAHATGPSPAMGPPPSQANYNYGQPQVPDYGQPTTYVQTAPPAQSYGHGYNETKYDNQVAMQHPYGGHGALQQSSAYPQGTSHTGYGLQDQYGKPPSYGMPPQGPHAQSYSQPRVNHSGDMPYQGPISSTHSYGPNASVQQQYPYVSSGQMQQTYPPYGSAAAADGYNNPPPTASGPGYPQQGGQPVSGYIQPDGQQAPGYAQVGPTGGYGVYPSSQPGYNEQVAPNNAGYGYQVPIDPAYNGGPASSYGAPTTGQPPYSQPAPTQLGSDQSNPQSGGYASVSGSAPVGYGMHR